MTRIIAGFAGSLRLKVPQSGTRPTSDKVREAVFSALEARDAVDGARVLDLYAGTGALGLEAASRGAASVTLVDKATAAARAARENAALVRSRAPRDGAVDVVVSSSSVRSFLSGSGGTWDLVFIDPPYELGSEELLADLEALAPRLADDAIVVVERSSRQRLPELPAGLELERRKDYGDTSLSWLRAVPAQPTEPFQSA